MLLVDGNVQRNQGFPTLGSVGKRCFMRLSSLWVAAVLLVCSATFAQHSSGGGSSGGSSGGGSHSTSSGGSSSSSSSASSHSSGGSVSHGSSVHGSNSGSASSTSPTRESHSSTERSIREQNAGAQSKTVHSEKKSFFSFLRHPFRKPEPKPDPKAKLVADRRRPICVHGRCLVCPAGQAYAGGGCVGRVANHRNNFCSASELWSGGACLLQTRFLDDCSGLRMAMERQAQRMQAAESAQQSACTTNSRQGCSDLTSTAQSEANLYRALQDRYRLCQQRALPVNPFGRAAVWSYSHGLLFDPLSFDLDYR